jgi:hypothetical protein
LLIIFYLKIYRILLKYHCMKRYLRIIPLLPFILFCFLSIPAGFSQSPGLLPYPEADFDCGGGGCTTVHTGGILEDIVLNGSESCIICIQGPVTNEHLNVNINGSGTATLVFCAPGTYTIPGTILQSIKEKVTIIVNSGANVELNGGAIQCQVINRGVLTLSNTDVNLNPKASIVNAGQINLQNIVCSSESGFTNYGYVNASGKFGNIDSRAFVYLANQSLVEAGVIGDINSPILGNGGCIRSKSSVGNLNPSAKPLTPFGDTITVCIAENSFPADWINNKGGAALNSSCNECTSTPLSPLTVTITGNLSVCPNEPTVLTSSVEGNGSYSYKWERISGSIITEGTNVSVTLTPVVTTTYRVTVTDNATGQTGSATATVTIKSAGECSPLSPLDVSVTPESGQSVCAGESAQLTAGASGGSGNYSYAWTRVSDNTPAGTTASVTVSPAVTTTYTVTVTDNATGQTVSATATVTIKSTGECSPLLPLDVSITPEGGQSVCVGESVQLTAGASGGSGNYSYAWARVSDNTSVGTTASVTVSPAVTTTYTVTVTDQTTGQSGSAMVAVTVKPAEECPSVTPPVPSTCATDPGDKSCQNCDPLTQYNVNSGMTVCLSSPGTYSMSLSGTLIICGNGTFTLNGQYNSESIIYINSGATVELQVTEISLKIYNRGILNIPNSVTVNGNGLVLNTGIFNVNGALQLDAGLTNMNRVDVSGNLYLNGSSDVILSNGSIMKIMGTSTLDGGINGCGGCLHSVHKVYGGNYVANRNKITPDNDLVYICGQDGFDNKFTLDASGNGTSGGAILQGGCTECMPVLPGLTVTLTLEDNESLCAGESTILAAGASGGSGNYSYVWIRVSDNTSVGTTASVTVSPFITTTYTVTVTDQSTGQTGNETVTITVKPSEECPPLSPLDVSITAGDGQSLCSGESTILTASATGGSGDYSYVWTQMSDNTPAGITASVTVSLSVTTTYTVTVTDQSTGQTGNETVTITVKPSEECPPLSPLDVSITAGGGQSLCSGESTILTASATGGSGNYSYVWTRMSDNTPAGTTASVTVSLSVTTTYTVTVTDQSTGQTGNETVTITVKLPEECSPVTNNCVTDPGDMLVCDSCEEIYNGMEARNGKVVCAKVPGTYSMTLEGSTLVVCGPGEFTLQGSYRNDSRIYINSGATLTISHFESNTKIYNRGMLTVNSDVNINGIGSILNTGTMRINGDFGVDAFFDNLGSVLVTGDLRLNGNAKATLGDKSVLKTTRVSTIDAQVFGCGGCLHSIEKMNHANILNNSPGRILTPVDNQVFVCSQEGFGSVFVIDGNGRSGGAVMQSGCEGCEFPQTPDDSIKITIGGTLIICSGDSTTLTAVVEDTAQYTYKWSGGGVDTTGSVLRVSPDSTTTYKIVVTDNNNQPKGSAFVTVSVLKARITSRDSIHTTLTASAGDHYLWSTAETSQSITVSTPSAPILYWVEITFDSKTCTDTITVTPYVPDQDSLVVTIEGSRSVCANTPVTLTAHVAGNGDYTYKWVENGVAREGRTITISPAVITTYTVTVTEKNTLRTGKAQVKVEVFQCPDPVSCGILVDLADSEYECSGCQTPVLDGTRLTLNNAGRYCLTTPVPLSQVSVNHQGAVLVICGSGTFDLGELNLNGGDLIIGENAVVICRSQGVNHPGSDLYNRGHLVVSGLYGNPFSLNGGNTVNMGNLTVNGNLNPSNNSGGSFANYGKIDITGTLGPFNAGNIYLEPGSVVNTKNIGDMNANANIMCSGCIHYTGSIGNINTDYFTGGNLLVCRHTGSGNIPNWGEAEVESDCDHCRLVLIPPKDVSVCDTVFEKGSGSIRLKVHLSGGSGGPYTYSWSSGSGSGSGTHPQGGRLHPLTFTVPVSVSFPLTSDHVEEVTLTVTDPADGKSETVKVKYTIERCKQRPACCNRMLRIKIAGHPDSGCENGGNNGKLVFEQKEADCGNSETENTPVCSVIWRNSDYTELGRSFELNNLPAGTYYAEIDCGNECSGTEKIILESKPGNPGTGTGLLATYYKSTQDSCKFSGENILPPSPLVSAGMDFDWTETPLSVNGLHAIRWTGYIKATCTGEYTFYKTSNLPGTLYIKKSVHEAPVMDTGQSQGTIYLEAGMSYPFIYELTGYSPDGKLKLEWETPCSNSGREVIPSCVLKPDALHGAVVPTHCPADPECVENPAYCCEAPVSGLPKQVDICRESDRKILLNAFADGAISYSWSNQKNTPSIEVDPVSATYSVTITSWCGTSVTESVSVRALDDISVGILPKDGETVYACNGESIPLKAIGGVSWRWSPSDYLDDPAIFNPTATPQSSTTYTVAITTQGGCVFYKTVRVEIAAPFELRTGKEEITGCKGEPVQLHVSGADSYSWYPKDGFNCNDCPDPIYYISGNTTLHVYGKKDNCVIEKQVKINQIPDEIKFSYVKNGCSVSFEAIGDPAVFSKYSWTFGDGTVDDTGKRVIDNHIYPGQGLYHVCLEAENSCGRKAYYCGHIEITSQECPCQHDPCD